MTLLEHRRVEYRYINIVLKRGNGLVDWIHVKGYQQGTDIVIYENEHVSEVDVIGTFLHELAHFLTSDIHEDHGYKFLTTCSMIMTLVENLVVRNVQFRASKSGSNMKNVGEKQEVKELHRL
jgi:hypothetical protein